MRSLVINILLVGLALALFVPLYIVNLVIVWVRRRDLAGFFRSTALSIDHYANYEFRTLFNAVLIKTDAPVKFGNFYQSISYVLAVNKGWAMLTETGRWVVWIVELADPGHFDKTLDEYRNDKTEI